MVVDAATGHLVECELDRVQGRVVAGSRNLAEQHPQIHGMRKLGCRAEASVDGVEVLEQHPGRLVKLAKVEWPLAAGGDFPHRAQPLGHLGGRTQDLVAAFLPGPVHAQQHSRKTRHAPGIRGRKIGSTIEGLEAGREKHRHRPAAVAGHRLDRVHVDLVQVGTLLAVNFDVDEVLVHHRGDVGVLEAFSLHHMAPVAGRVADRQEDRLVLAASSIDCPGPPGMPVNRVVRVLQQVGAGLPRELVGRTVVVVRGVRACRIHEGRTRLEGRSKQSA